jgi:alpha-1,3-rhamnosyl/mannosyltransferase
MTGIGRMLRSLYREMELLPDVEISYFNGKTVVDEMPSFAKPGAWISKTSLVWKLPDPIVFGLRSGAWLMLEHRLRNVLKSGSYDVYHETAFTPSRVAGITPQVHTIYDMSLVKYSDMHPRERVMFFDVFYKRRLPEANRILTISEYIASELVEEFGIDRKRIDVVHLAPDACFSPRPSDQVEEYLRDKGLPREYLLFVGSMEPRKNLDGLIAALERCDADVPLCIVGWEGWGEKTWQEMVVSRGLGERIFTLGYVSDDDLALLYSGALALVYPSYYEGFGLPILEAMACGCPVVCSNVSSMPEVAGNAALFFDPTDVNTICQALTMIVGDTELRKQLSNAGFTRSKFFSWKKAAHVVSEVFKTNCLSS